MKKRYEVTVSCMATVEVDEDLLPDDEWRSHFYPICDMEDLARHLGYNFIINNCSLSQLDGFADRKDDQAKIVGAVDYETEAWVAE